MHQPKFVSAEELRGILPYPFIQQVLKEGLKKDIQVPGREHYDLGHNRLFLTMPAWQINQYAGIKLLTVFPDNPARNLPSIQGLYLLFDARSGSNLINLDASELTNLRTSAMSALMASLLGRPDRKNYLLIGTGSLAPYMVRAHMSSFHYQVVSIWGRDQKKADVLKRKLAGYQVEVQCVRNLEKAVREADVISMCTSSQQPLLQGSWLKEGSHLDLVGSFQHDMREVDDLAILSGRIYIDSPDAPSESGDLFQPIKSGLMTKEQIAGTAAQLCKAEIPGRLSQEEIIIYKSVGHAPQDLCVAIAVYENWRQKNNHS